MPKTRKAHKTTSPSQKGTPKPGVPDFAKDIMNDCVQAKRASQQLAVSSTEIRHRALEAMAKALENSQSDIQFKNEIDIEVARKTGLTDALIDRLTLTPQRIRAMAQGLRDMMALPDPVGEIIEDRTQPNGMRLQKVRVPLGVVSIIYESRPNVTVDCAGLCIKSGNAVILRGGKEAINSNTALAHIIQNAAYEAGLPPGSIQLIQSTDRALIRDLVRMDKLIDLVIPRGGEEMVKAVRDMATVPVLSHGKGLCTVYIDKDADLGMAENIAFNAKTQRPGVCNAMETLLVHQDIAPQFIPGIIKRYEDAHVQIRGDAHVQNIGGDNILPAQEKDWDTEFLKLTAAIRVVPSLEEALVHIAKHSSRHSDSIVTNNPDTANRFLAEVDSAAVFHNASTRLHDGSVFGLGAEMGISTQKMHARGAMGIRELTTTKYVVRGTGQIRE